MVRHARKGVSEIVTYILLLAIGVTAVGTAVNFGGQILSKQETYQDLAEAEDMMNLIEKTIDEVAKGKDPKVLELPLKGTFSIDQETDSVTYEVLTEKSSYGTTEILLNDWLPAYSGTTINVGVVNRNHYGALSVKALGTQPGQQTIQYALQFRPLADTDALEQRTLDLKTLGQVVRTQGQTYTLAIEKGQELKSGSSIRIPIQLTLS